MSNPLDEKLARFEELERQLVDPVWPIPPG